MNQAEAANDPRVGSGSGTALPVLSLIACSRNDDYLGGARWRLQTGLNLTARTIHELGLEDSIEILLTDWGSDEPIREVLELTPEAARLVRMIEVPREMAERYQRDAPFSEVHALNAAARRSRGEYIGRIDQDTILGAGFLRRFFDLYHGRADLGVPLERAVMLSNRRGIPFRFAAQRPSPWVVDRFVRWFGRSLPLAKPLPEPLYFQSYVGIWMIHRDLWFEIRGYDESFIYINWMEADMILRLESKYPFVNLGRVIDHDIFHLDHIHPLAHWGAKGRIRRENPVRDRDNLPSTVLTNSAEWGLGGESIEPRPYELKPGEGDAALAPLRGSQWGSFLVRTALFGIRYLGDRTLLLFLRVAMAGPRLLLHVAPGLREPWGAYRDAVRGHPLTQWPGRMWALRRARSGRAG